MTDSPAWLTTARALKGLLEAPGSTNNPVILAWPRQIADRWPDMAAYTRLYSDDSIPWCGLFVAYCLSTNGIRPAYDDGSSDTDRFLWAQAWADWGTPTEPRLGAIMVFTREGGGHVAFYEHEDDDNYWVTGGNQGDSVSTIAVSKTQFTAAVWPPGAEQLPTAGTITPAGGRSARFEQCIPLLLASEGGYTNHPADNGGPTNWGITIHDARAYWRSNATAADVRAMPVEVAKQIFHDKYWNALWCNQLPAGVDYLVFDTGVLSGNSRAAKFLQEIVQTDIDGEIGPITVAATLEADPHDLIREYSDVRLATYKTFDDWPTFGNGWTNRIVAVEKAALAMVTAAKPVIPPVIVTPEPTMPEPVTPTAPVKLPVAEMIEALAAYKKAHPEEYAAMQQTVGKLLMKGIKLVTTNFPQLAVFGFFAQYLLSTAGFMGMPIGEAVTTTGQVTGASLATLLASWAVSQINRRAP